MKYYPKLTLCLLFFASSSHLVCLFGLALSSARQGLARGNANVCSAQSADRNEHYSAHNERYHN